MPNLFVSFERFSKILGVLFHSRWIQLSMTPSSMYYASYFIFFPFHQPVIKLILRWKLPSLPQRYVSWRSVYVKPPEKSRNANCRNSIHDPKSTQPKLTLGQLTFCKIAKTFQFPEIFQQARWWEKIGARFTDQPLFFPSSSPTLYFSWLLNTKTEKESFEMQAFSTVL